MPLEDTDAIEGASDRQLGVWPLTTLPAGSVGVAVARAILPGASDTESTETATAATGFTSGSTVTDDDPLQPDIVACITATPTLIAVIMPFDDTLATGALSLDHSTESPATGFPFLPVTLRPAWMDLPAWSLAGLIVTESSYAHGLPGAFFPNRRMGESIGSTDFEESEQAERRAATRTTPADSESLRVCA